VLDDAAAELEEVGELELDGSAELDVLELCAAEKEELVELEDVDEAAAELEDGAAELNVLELCAAEELLGLEDVDEAAADDIEDDVELVELELDDTEGAGQSCAWMKAELSVIDAPRANRPPMLVASAFAVIETAARTLPTKSEPIPRVALVPTFQNTLQG
jgi:hypothetical protein